MPLDSKTGKLGAYTHKQEKKVRGSPIDPAMGSSLRLLGSVSLTKKELGDVDKSLRHLGSDKDKVVKPAWVDTGTKYK